MAGPEEVLNPSVTDVVDACQALWGLIFGDGMLGAFPSKFCDL